MEDMDVHGRLAAHSLLVSLALALAIRDDPQPGGVVREVLESMKGTIDSATAALPDSAPQDYAEHFVGAFNSELDSVHSMAIKMLGYMRLA